MTRKIATLGVDVKFFDNVFEKERKNMQKKLGLNNLSQANFTKMIKGFKIKKPKQDLFNINTKIKRENVKI